MIPRPDAEAAWIAWIRPAFPQASTRIAPQHFDGMMRVSRVGGRRVNMLQDAATMLVEVWHKDAFKASEIAHDVAERIEQATDGTMLDATTRVSNVTTTGPLEFPDPSSALKRYQFTAEALLRRTAA